MLTRTPGAIRSSALGLEDVEAGVDEIRRCLVARRLLDEGLDPSGLVDRHHAESRRILDRGERDGPFGSPTSVKVDQSPNIEVGQHVAVDDEERVVDPDVAGRKADGAGGVHGLWFDGVREMDTTSPVVGKGSHEGVGSVAH